MSITKRHASTHLLALSSILTLLAPIGIRTAPAPPKLAPPIARPSAPPPASAPLARSPGKPRRHWPFTKVLRLLEDCLQETDGVWLIDLKIDADGRMRLAFRVKVDPEAVVAPPPPGARRGWVDRLVRFLEALKKREKYVRSVRLKRGGGCGWVRPPQFATHEMTLVLAPYEGEE